VLAAHRPDLLLNDLDDAPALIEWGRAS
jgi:hypothetical protein